MNLSTCDFTNELGNPIQMVVFEDKIGVTITASGPSSQVEHTWTKKEASVLMELLRQIGVKPDRKTLRSKKK